MLDADALADLIAELIGDHVERATAPLIERIAQLEAREVSVPVTMAEVSGAVDAGIELALAALPVPQDGVSVTVEDLAPLVRSTVEEAMSALPVPQDGVSVTAEDVRPLVEAEVARAVAALPAAQEGVGLAGAVIDRDGRLVLTLSDGKAVELGAVVGRDADPAEIARLVKDAVDAIPRPKDGRDGFELEAFDIEAMPDGRTIEMSFTAGELKHTYELQFPVPLYRGAYRGDKTYVRGDMVSWGGSLWHADSDTTGKPEDGDWTLAVKRGRDGKGEARP